MDIEVIKSILKKQLVKEQQEEPMKTMPKPRTVADQLKKKAKEFREKNADRDADVADQSVEFNSGNDVNATPSEWKERQTLG